MPARAVPLATRRATLGACLGVLTGGGLLAGCDAGREERPTSAPTGSATPSADLLLTQQALDATTSMLAVLTASRTRRPSLRRELDPMVRVHRAHRGVLTDVGASPGAVVDAGAPVRAVATLREVLVQERALERDLASWALAAEDGSVARLLAVLSAGVAQELARSRPRGGP